MVIPSQRSILIAILILALGVRLGFGLQKDSHRAALRDLPDQDQYVQVAREWSSGNGWRFWDDRFGQWVYGVRTPGYPAFLLLCNNATIRCVRAVQAILDTSTVLAAYLLARRLMGSRAGLLAAGILALNPFLIYFSSLILTETLFTTLLAWSLYLLACRRWTWAAAGMLAIGAIVRTSGLPLAVLLPAAVALFLGDGWRRVLLQFVLGAMITFVVFAPWAFRNDVLLGQWVWTTTNDGITAYDGLNPRATGASDQSFVKSMPDLQRMNELQRNAYFAKLTGQFVRENPGKVATLAMAKTARTWSPVPLSGQFGSSRIYRLAALGYALPVFILAAIGLLAGVPPLDSAGGKHSPSLRTRMKLLLLLPAIVLTIIHAGSVGSLRYRMPAEPQVAILAAGGAIAILRRPRYNPAR